MSVEPSAETWLTVKRFAEEQIEDARDMLERPGPLESVQFHRGRIQALREVLSLADPKPTVGPRSADVSVGY